MSVTKKSSEPSKSAGGPSLSETLLQKPYLLFAVSFVILLVVWEWTVIYFEVDDFIFPAPSGVATALMRGLFFYDVGGDVEGAADFMGLMKTSFYNHISHTLFEAIMGFFMGSIIGLGLGLAFMQSKWVEAIIMPYVVAFQTLPKLAIAPPVHHLVSATK